MLFAQLDLEAKTEGPWASLNLFDLFMFKVTAYRERC